MTLLFLTFSSIVVDGIRRADDSDHFYADMTFDGEKASYLFRVTDDDEEDNSVGALDSEYGMRFHRSGREAREAVPSLLLRFRRGEQLVFPARIVG